MHIGTRPIAKGDFNNMVRLCQPELFRDVTRLRQEWDTLWSTSRFMGVVVEDSDLPPDQRALALIGAVYISDEFFEECLKAEEPFPVSKIVARIRMRKRCVLGDEELAIQNAGDGVVVYMVYLAWLPTGYENVRAETLRSLLVNAFADRYQGNNVRWIVGETAGGLVRDVALRAGCQVLNSYEKWDAPKDLVDHDLLPALVGASREGDLTLENYWFHKMFTYMTPRFGFTDSQRQVLLAAREGLTDVEIAADLGVSADAIKKRWGGIYDRVEAVLPGLLPESQGTGRGAEKRRALLAHLRDRPEELRPHEKRSSGMSSAKAG